MTPRRVAVVSVLSLVVAACYDFVEPDFPEAGAPAVFQAAVSIDEAGSFSLNGVLAPGLAIGGVQRRVVNDTLSVYDFRIAPVNVRRNGSREYSFAGAVNGTDVEARPLELLGPVVAEVAGPPPRISWFGVRKADPDTLTWQRGTDLVLRIETELGASLPPPPIRQWFLDLRGSNNNFRVSADGVPPAELVIPSYWVPETVTGLLLVSMLYYQSGQQQSPGKDYIGLFSFNVQLRWVVRVEP